MSLVEEHCVFSCLNSLAYGSSFTQLNQSHKAESVVLKHCSPRQIFPGEGEEPKPPKGKFQQSLFMGARMMKQES